MGLSVEIGTGANANANSYGVTDAAATRAAARAYASDRGVTTLPVAANPDPLDALLIKATDYLNSIQDYVGCQTSADQPLPWPRQNVAKSDGSLFPSNQLPQALLNALYQLCIEQANGIDLFVTAEGAASGTAGAIVREKTDVLETEYSDKVGTTTAPLMPAVNALLRLLRRNGGSFLTVRV